MDIVWIYTAISAAILWPLIEGIKWLILLPLYQLRVNETVLVREIDHLIVKTGWFSTLQYIGLTEVPWAGLHFVRIGDQWVLVWRYYEQSRDSSAPNYLLVTRYRINNLPQLLLTEDGNFELWFEPTPHTWAISNAEMRVVPLPSKKPYKWQESAVHQLAESYFNNEKGGFPDHASMLIWGETGHGKSTLPNYLAQYLTDKHDMRPCIIRGFNPSIPGITIAILESVCLRTSKTPLIIVLDEYNKVAEQAMAVKTTFGSTSACYAQDKTSLCNFRDRLDSMKYVFVISTMNSKPPTDGELLPFFRKESFRYQIESERLHGEEV